MDSRNSRLLKLSEYPFIVDQSFGIGYQPYVVQQYLVKLCLQLLQLHFCEHEKLSMGLKL